MATTARPGRKGRDRNRDASDASRTGEESEAPKREPSDFSAFGDTWKQRFLEVFEDSQLVSEAARVAGVARSTVYRERKADAKFAAAWAEVEERAIEELEKVAYQRASEGSDRLVEFLLKAKRPETYRERLSIEDDRTKRAREEADQLSDEELDQRLAGVEDGSNVVSLDERRSA